MQSRIGTWTIRLMAMNDQSDGENQQVYDEFLKDLNEIEDTLSMSVPDGYYVKIDAS